MKLCKITIAVMAATVLLGILGASASARNLSLSSQFFATVFRSVTFNLPFGDTVCVLSISGSLHTRTIAKVTGSLIGYINRAILGGCPAGAATVLTETLPWRVTYRNFTGTLPSVTGMGTDVLDVSLRVREPASITCLARSTVARPATTTYINEARTISVATLGGSVPTSCGVNGTFSSDRGPVTTVVGGTTRITVTLI